MSAIPANLSQLNKVVVAFVDGRRLKGYVYNFSALKDWFDLLPQENPLQARGERVELKSVKAIFFVKDFTGRRERNRAVINESKAHGRKIEVKCQDGETMIGTTEGYNPQKLGFFMFPAGEDDNNIRAFIINKNIVKTRWL